MSPKKIELPFSALIVLLIVWALWEARAWPLHSRLYPWSIGFSVLGLALLQLGSAAVSVLRPKESIAEERSGQPPGESTADPEIIRQRVISILVWILLFFLGIWLLGFKVGSLVLTFAFLRWGASESWRIGAAFAVSSYLFFLIVFDFALRVPLAAGWIAESLGLDSLDSYVVKPIMNLFGGR